MGHESVAAAGELAAIGRPALPALFNALEISSDAYLAVGLIGGEEAFQVLFAKLQLGMFTNNSTIIKAASRGLGYLHDKRSLTMLQLCLNNPIDYEAKRECSEAIKRIQTGK